MPVTILMPALSPTMAEGTLAKWHVSEGDSISAGDLLAEIETDKAVMEFEAVEDGIVGKLLVSEGEAGIAVNTPVAVLLEQGESLDDAKDFAPQAEQPTIAETQSVGDPPALPATVAPAATGPKTSPADALPRNEAGQERIFASPLARRLAKEKGLQLSSIAGSGPGGRIIKSDIVKAAELPQPAPASAPAPEKPASAPKAADWKQISSLYPDREFVEVSLDGMRKTIAARLVEAKQTIPHFYLRREIHLDELLRLRVKVNDALKPKDMKVSINDFIIRASALALQQVPGANSVWAHDRILQFASSDVAVAVAVDGGLFTPVIRDAQLKSLAELSEEMKQLAEKARTRRLKPTEYSGGSFSISNLGMFGIENFDAVINPPHGSILAVGAGRRIACEGKDGRAEFRTSMSVTLSCDHRVIDGALGAQFLAEIARHLENPLLLLL